MFWIHYNNDFSLAFNVFANVLVVLGGLEVVAFGLYVVHRVYRRIRGF